MNRERGGTVIALVHALGYNSNMNGESIRELLRRQPFEPFEVVMTNGERYTVRHPEVAFLAGSRLLIYFPEGDRLVWCSLLHVANVIIPQAA